MCISRGVVRGALTCLILAAACTRSPAVTIPRPAAGKIEGLRIDPMLLVSVVEVRRILEAIGDSNYPGLSAERVPLLLYRPGAHVASIVRENASRKTRGRERLQDES